MADCAINGLWLDAVVREVRFLINRMAVNTLVGSMNRHGECIRVESNRNFLVIHLLGQVRITMAFETIGVRLRHGGDPQRGPAD